MLQSKEFWQFAAPLFHEAFPFTAEASADDFYRTYNRVAPGCIRVEADEVTYPLHVTNPSPDPSPNPNPNLNPNPSPNPNPNQVTYPLHVILRYDIERKLFRGEMSVDEVPHEPTLTLTLTFTLTRTRA